MKSTAIPHGEKLLKAVSKNTKNGWSISSFQMDIRGGMMHQLATETSWRHKAYLAKPLVRHSMVSLFVSCKDHALRPAIRNQSNKVQPCVCYEKHPIHSPRKQSSNRQPQEKNSFKISQVGVFGNFLPRITNLPTFFIQKIICDEKVQALDTLKSPSFAMVPSLVWLLIFFVTSVELEVCPQGNVPAKKKKNSRKCKNLWMLDMFLNFGWECRTILREYESIFYAPKIPYFFS